jgi:hypothetical protein
MMRRRADGEHQVTPNSRSGGVRSHFDMHPVRRWPEVLAARFVGRRMAKIQPKSRRECRIQIILVEFQPPKLGRNG